LKSGPIWDPFFWDLPVQRAYAGFLDIGFLRAEGAKVLGIRPSHVRPNAVAVAKWLRGLSERKLRRLEFLRAYWYDGTFDPSHPKYEGQRRFFSSIAQTPGVQLRLG